MIVAIHIVVCELLGVCLQIIIYSRFIFFLFSIYRATYTALRLCIAIRGGVYVANSLRNTRLSYGWAYSPNAPRFFDKSSLFAYFLRRRERRERETEEKRRKKNARLTNDCDFEKAPGTYVDAGRGAVTCYLSSNDNTQAPMEWAKALNVLILSPSMSFYALNVHTHIRTRFIHCWDA